MGKRILVQRRGRGSSVFRASSHKRVAKASYLPPSEQEKTGVIKFTVKELRHEPGRGTPLAKVEYEDGRVTWLPAVEGMYVGQTLEQGVNAAVEVGNILPLEKIPEGTWICNVETHYGDGGQIARSSGSHAIVVTHSGSSTYLQLPSRAKKAVSSKCRATIGVIAAGGRKDKPFLKAGKKRAWMRAKGHKYPRVRGVAMNPVSHPFGGGAHQHVGRSTTVSRHAPPGKKVGLIAARRTGRKRGRQPR